MHVVYPSFFIAEIIDIIPFWVYDKLSAGEIEKESGVIYGFSEKFTESEKKGGYFTKRTCRAATSLPEGYKPLGTWGAYAVGGSVCKNV